jgi:integrase
MATVYKPKGRNHYVIEYLDENGKRCREFSGTTDRATADLIARDLENRRALKKKGIISGEDEKFRDESARPLSAHLGDWYRDMVAKGRTAAHADQYRERAGRVIALTRGKSWAELIPGRKAGVVEHAAEMLAGVLAKARFSDLTPEQLQQALFAIREAGRSAQTANHHFAAVKAFLRWCCDRSRLRKPPLQGVESYNVAEDVRHVRRCLTDAEMARLIAHAETAPDRWGMPGSLRAMAYLTAASTGFRAAEMRSLTPQSFRLDGVRPSIFLKAAAAKNGKPADQPIARAVADRLRRWLRDKPAGRPVFPLDRDMAKAIRCDLKAIGVAYETDEGVADFHSLRSYYISSLIRSGRSIKEVQVLARHAKAETTLAFYAKVSAFDLANAVESLPDLTGDDRPLAATGTDAADTVLMSSTPHRGASRRK